MRANPVTIRGIVFHRVPVSATSASRASKRIARHLAAADGFRLSTASATLDDSTGTYAMILKRAGLLAFAKSLKPKDAPVTTIDVASDS